MSRILNLPPYLLPYLRAERRRITGVGWSRVGYELRHGLYLLSGRRGYYTSVQRKHAETYKAAYPKASSPPGRLPFLLRPIFHAKHQKEKDIRRFRYLNLEATIRTLMFQMGALEYTIYHHSPALLRYYRIRSTDPVLVGIKEALFAFSPRPKRSFMGYWLEDMWTYEEIPLTTDSLQPGSAHSHKGPVTYFGVNSTLRKKIC